MKREDLQNLTEAYQNVFEASFLSKLNPFKKKPEPPKENTPKKNIVDYLWALTSDYRYDTRGGGFPAIDIKKDGNDEHLTVSGKIVASYIGPKKSFAGPGVEHEYTIVHHPEHPEYKKFRFRNERQEIDAAIDAIDKISKGQVWINDNKEQILSDLPPIWDRHLDPRR